MTKLRRTLTMASLVLAGECIYTLPYYLRRDYAKVIVDGTAGEVSTRIQPLGV